LGINSQNNIILTLQTIEIRSIGYAVCQYDKKTPIPRLSDGRYVYETKRPLQLCWLATSGTQEGRIAHHLCITATMPPFFASEAAKPSAAHRGSTWFRFWGAKRQVVFITSKYLGCFFFRQFFIKSLEVSNNYRNFAAGIKERIILWHQLHLKIVHAMK
jgi:hypothetical protein